MFGLIKDIMKPLGVSGREGPVRDVIKERIAPYVDEITTDALGNLIAHKKAHPVRKSLCLPLTWMKSAFSLLVLTMADAYVIQMSAAYVLLKLYIRMLSLKMAFAACLLPTTMQKSLI